MDFSTALENLALSYGWRFVHARRDYQNLTDAINYVSDELEGYGNGETVLFLDPVERSGRSPEITYSGNFMVLTRSDIDDTYEGKREKYIVPLLETVHGTMQNNLICEFDLDAWRSIEVINMFDFNADGLSVRFSAKGY